MIEVGSCATSVRRRREELRTAGTATHFLFIETNKY